jgi:hypothetical protein
MDRQLRTIAEAIVTGAKLTHAAAWMLYSAFWLLLAFWAGIPLGNPFWTVLALCLAACGMGCIVKAAQLYASARPPERPDDRQRYLASRSLYIPRAPGRPKQRD